MMTVKRQTSSHQQPDHTASEPRRGSAGRGSPEPGLWLDGAGGRAAAERRVSLPCPTDRIEPLLACCDSLVEGLCEDLAAAGQVALRLRLRLVLDGGGERLLDSRPARLGQCPGSLQWLLRQALTDLRLAAPVVAVGLSAPARCPWPGLGASGALRGLLARLAEQLGAEVLLRPELSERYRPEESWAAGSLPFQGPRRSPGRWAGCRPAVLLPEPERLLLRVDGCGTPTSVALGGRWRLVRAAAGPERLTGGWWERRPLDRDYYRLVLSGGSGRVCWIYRDRLDGSWWLQGWFD